MCKRLVALVVLGGVWLLLGGSSEAAPRVTVGQPRVRDNVMPGMRELSKKSYSVLTVSCTNRNLAMAGGDKTNG
jgi:hypothetical protein